MPIRCRRPPKQSAHIFRAVHASQDRKEAMWSGRRCLPASILWNSIAERLQQKSALLPDLYFHQLRITATAFGSIALTRGVKKSMAHSPHSDSSLTSACAKWLRHVEDVLRANAVRKNR